MLQYIYYRSVPTDAIYLRKAKLAMKMYEGVAVQLQAFLATALHGTGQRQAAAALPPGTVRYTH
jgi:hypothetical protein